MSCIYNTPGDTQIDICAPRERGDNSERCEALRAAGRAAVPRAGRAGAVRAANRRAGAPRTCSCRRPWRRWLTPAGAAAAPPARVLVVIDPRAARRRRRRAAVRARSPGRARRALGAHLGGPGVLVGAVRVDVDRRPAARFRRAHERRPAGARRWTTSRGGCTPPGGAASRLATRSIGGGGCSATIRGHARDCARRPARRSDWADAGRRPAALRRTCATSIAPGTTRARHRPAYRAAARAADDKTRRLAVGVGGGRPQTSSCSRTMDTRGAADTAATRPTCGDRSSPPAVRRSPRGRAAPGCA